MRRIAITLSLIAFPLCGQQPVPIIRKPPTQADYANAARVVSAPLPRRPKAKTQSPMIMGNIEVSGDKPIILPESAIQAIQLEADWRNRQSAPMLGDDGKIVYVYGHGQPNIPVSPLKICTIEFEPGETLDQSGLEIGDSERWSIKQHQIMRNGQLQAFITVKPTYAGLDTPMTVFTSQRAYYFRLLSDSTGYIERVGFTYPDEDLKKKQEAILIAKEEEGRRLAAAAEEARKAEELHQKNTDGPIKDYNYSVHASKHASYMRPVMVGDNGYHTKIQLPESVRNRDIPTLTITNHTGPDSPNFAYNEQKLVYTVDGLFSAAQLRVGTGKHKLTVDIIKNEKR